MNVALRVNTLPIVAGDDVTVDIILSPWEVGAIFYSVHLSFDGGVTFARTLSRDVSAFGRSYDWRVDAIGTALRIRVDQHTMWGLVARRAMSGPFAVVPAAPRVTAPDAEETVGVGSYTVRWEQDRPNPNSYRLFFSTDGGENLQLLRQDIPGTARSATVTIPGPATDDAVLIARGMFAGFAPVDDFVPIRTSAGPVVRVTSPARNAIWRIGESERIAWEASGAVTSFRIRLSRGGAWTTIFSSVGANQRQVQYVVDPPASTSCRVRVQAVGPDGSDSDTSGTFRIRV